MNLRDDIKKITSKNEFDSYKEYSNKLKEITKAKDDLKDYANEINKALKFKKGDIFREKNGTIYVVNKAINDGNTYLLVVITKNEVFKDSCVKTFLIDNIDNYIENNPELIKCFEMLNAQYKEQEKKPSRKLKKKKIKSWDDVINNLQESIDDDDDGSLPF